MNNKINNEELLNICLQDRYNAFASTKLPVVKKLNIDLIVKYIILLFNSFGTKKCENIIFVDEVNNNSMYNNLYNTYNHCLDKKLLISLRKITIENHVKSGFFFNIYQFIVLFFGHIIIYSFSIVLGIEYLKEKSSSLLIALFQQYINVIIKNNNNIVVYTMTDHNFYSSIICNCNNIDSYVIQHGLILGLSYYNNFLANHFIAWGKRSKEILNNDDRVIVKGTYKFDKIKKRTSESRNIVLYCISTLDFTLVAKKIEILAEVLKNSGYSLAVKLHPGSLFNNSGLEDKFKNLTFYKEENINEIDFGLAIIENSTILIDMLYLEKKFIVFDNNKGYFSRYSSIPFVNNREELIKVIRNVDKYDYDKLHEEIMNEELNGGKCSIFE